MYQKWQATLFSKLIDDLLSQISTSQLNWFQFNLVLKEGCIKFRTLSEQLKFRKYFQSHEFITKDLLKHLLILSQTLISNNKRFFVIRIKENQQDLLHKPYRCFEWWKQWMTQKYGPDLKWFDVMCMQKDCFRLKSFKLKNNLMILLKDTPHANCYLNITSFFPKVIIYQKQTQKNQIEFSSFMSTIKASIKPAYVDTRFTKRQLNKLSHCKALTQKQKIPMIQKSKQKIQRFKTQTSQTFYVTEWGSEQQDKVQRRSNNYVRGTVLRKKSLSKTTVNFYSIPVKESVEKIKRNERYKSTFI